MIIDSPAKPVAVADLPAIVDTEALNLAEWITNDRPTCRLATAIDWRLLEESLEDSCIAILISAILKSGRTVDPRLHMTVAVASDLTVEFDLDAYIQAARTAGEDAIADVVYAVGCGQALWPTHDALASLTHYEALALAAIIYATATGADPYCISWAEPIHEGE